MSLLSSAYNLASRSFKYGPVKKLKSVLRPIKHFLVGKNGIYEAIDIVKSHKGGSGIRVVFDVGAAVGDTAVVLLRAFPSSHVYCFEPLPDSFAQLKKQVAVFGDRVECFNFALSQGDGEAEFYIQAARDSSSFVRRPSDKPGNFIKVKTGRLDDVVKELGVQKIDFMKIDVEGSEKELMAGGRNTFADKIDNLFIEINPLYYKGERGHFYLDVLEAIYRAGFSWVGIFGDFLFTKDK